MTDGGYVGIIRLFVAKYCTSFHGHQRPLLLIHVCRHGASFQPTWQPDLYSRNWGWSEGANSEISLINLFFLEIQLTKLLALRVELLQGFRSKYNMTMPKTTSQYNCASKLLQCFSLMSHLPWSAWRQTLLIFTGNNWNKPQQLWMNPNNCPGNTRRIIYVGLGNLN